jgi:hypothetical protein
MPDGSNQAAVTVLRSATTQVLVPEVRVQVASKAVAPVPAARHRVEVLPVQALQAEDRVPAALRALAALRAQAVSLQMRPLGTHVRQPSCERASQTPVS